LRLRQERYVLDVPSNTLVRELDPKRGRGLFERIEVWAARQPAQRWKTLTIRDGEKEPLRVKALKRRMQSKDADGRVGPAETAVVIQTLGKEPRTYYALSNAERTAKVVLLCALFLSVYNISTSPLEEEFPCPEDTDVIARTPRGLGFARGCSIA
jgi:hypothetical protein